MIGHAEDVGFDAHEKFVRNVVAENVSLVATDEASQYRHLTKAGLPHDKPLFAKYLSEALEGVASTSFGFRQPSCRVYNDTVGIVNAYDTFMGATKDGRPLTIHGRTTFGVHQTRRTVEDCNRPLLCHAPHSDLKHKTAIRC